MKELSAPVSDMETQMRMGLCRSHATETKSGARPTLTMSRTYDVHIAVKGDHCSDIPQLQRIV
jgi:hypothetical protein